MSASNNQKLHFNKGKVCTTFDDYDELVARVSSMPFKRGEWWPTDYQIEHYIRPNFDLCYEFIVWMLETGPAPETEEQAESKKKLNDLLIEKIEFVESYPDEEEIAS